MPSDEWTQYITRHKVATKGPNLQGRDLAVTLRLSYASVPMDVIAPIRGPGRACDLWRRTMNPDMVCRRYDVARIDYTRIPGDPLTALRAVDQYVKQGTLEPSLMELVKIRASQLNGCAYCLDMHTKDAAARGEDQQRINCLSAWRECPFYSERERSALFWTEKVTLIADYSIDDDDFEQVREQFSEPEVVELTLAIASINTWNRVAISFKADVGSYQPPAAGNN